MLDLFIVLAFVGYSISAGFRAKRKASQNLTEYFLAGRTVRGWKAGASMAATQFAADTPLLVTGLIATGGIFLLWRLWIYGLAFLLMAFVLAAMWRRAGVLTDAEFTEVRYSGRGVLILRVLKAIYYGTVINCAVMAMVLIAAVRIAEVFLPWHEWLPEGIYGGITGFVSATGLTLGQSVTGLAPEMATANNLLSILLILGFVGLYSTTGGLRSVISTDVVQLGLALAGTAIYAWVVVDRVGGLGGLTDRVVEIYGNEAAARMLSFGPPGGEMLMPFLVIVGLQWFFQMNSDGTGYLVQRSMACSTDREARIAAVTFTWLQIFLRSLIWLVIGVGILVLYPFGPEEAGADGFAAAREMLFVTGVDDLLPVGVRGVMLTGLLAALASTVDTHLNWGASYWSNDIYRRLVCEAWQKRKPKNRELVVVARLSNLLILVLAVVVMTNLSSIQEAWMISLLFGAGMGSVLVLRWIWERINLYSELAAMVVSIAVAPILLVTTTEEWVRLATMAGLSTLAAVLAAFAMPRTDGATLERFYKRVRPMGFWGETARSVGDDPSAPQAILRVNLVTLALCGGSVFLLLTGVGRLLVPAPGIFGSVSVLMVVGGLLLIPVWWRRAFPKDEAEEEVASQELSGK